MRPLVAAVMALMVVAAPVAAASLTYDTTVKTNHDWTQEFVVTTGGTIDASASFVATNGVSYFEIRRLVGNQWLGGTGVTLDARWGRASGPQTLSIHLENQTAGQYRARFYAGRTTDLFVTLVTP